MHDMSISCSPCSRLLLRHTTARLPISDFLDCNTCNGITFEFEYTINDCVQGQANQHLSWASLQSAQTQMKKAWCSWLLHHLALQSMQMTNSQQVTAVPFPSTSDPWQKHMSCLQIYQAQPYEVQTMLV